MAFTRAEIRDILGEAHTDEIASKLINLHRSVLDPIRDDLDSEKRASAKWRQEAEKLPELQKKLEEYEKGGDWKAKYEKEHEDYEGYKTKVAKEANDAKVRAAYRKLLVDEKISEKTLEAVLNATDYSNIKLKEDGTLDGIEALKKDIDSKWGGFKAHVRQRGEQVGNPPKGGDNGADNSIRELTAKWHATKYGAAPAAQQNGGQAGT